MYEQEKVEAKKHGQAMERQHLIEMTRVSIAL